jgi:hypothetical protein
MISIIKEMIRDRKYKPDANIVESNEKMGRYAGQENDLVVLLARSFVNKHPFGANIDALAKKDISNFTFDYYKSIQKDIIDFAIILVVPSSTLDASIFEDDISVHGMTIFTEEELMFNPMRNTQDCFKTLPCIKY